MMHVIPCERVQADLMACHDGELPIETQVLIQGHLQECVACRLQAGDIRDIGEHLRAMAASVSHDVPNRAGLITGPVLERIKLERQFSFRVQVRSLFEDMHLVWAGLGATVATLFCVLASVGVLQAANQEKPDSLAAIISSLANQGSNDNPLRLGGSMLAPRAISDLTMPTSGEDGELTLSAVVTREGRIQNLELLEEQARALQLRPEVILALLDTASRARFEPAVAGGLPVAVNVVWLVATTTVRGRPDYDLYLVSPPRWTAPVHGPAVAPKRQTPPPKASAIGDEDSVAA
jgi:hypothetical protein